MSNLAVSIIGARYLSDTGFGAFATVYVLYLSALGVTRGLVCEPLLVYGTAPGAGRSALASATAVALTGSGLLTVSAPLVDPPLRSVLLALALVLPATLLLDVGRYVAFGRRRPQQALVLDVLWALVQVVGLIVVLVWWELDAVTLVLVWGGTSAAGVVYVWTAVGVAKPSFRWIAKSWDLSWRYTAEWMIGVGTTYVALLLLGPLAGLTAVGGVRAAQLLFGPLNVLFGGMLAVFVSEGALFDRGRLRRDLAKVSAGLSCLALVMTALFMVMPSSFGISVLGDTWAAAQPLILPAGLTAAAGGVLSGALAGLRSMREARATLGARLRLLPLLFSLPTLGGWVNGAPGFAWGGSVAAAVAAVVWWRIFLRALVLNGRTNGPE